MIIEWGCFRDSWNGIKTATPPFFDSKKVGHLEKTVLPFGGRPELPAASAWCQAPSRSHPGAIISHHFSQPWSTISYIKIIYNVIYKDIMSYIYIQFSQPSIISVFTISPLPTLKTPHSPTQMLKVPPMLVGSIASVDLKLPWLPWSF